jgi:hypothetical protein
MFNYLPIFSCIWKPFLKYMTLHPIPSEFPFYVRKISFSFFISATEQLHSFFIDKKVLLWKTFTYCSEDGE